VEDAVIPKSERRGKKKLLLLERTLGLGVSVPQKVGGDGTWMASSQKDHHQKTTTHVTKECGRYSYDVRGQGDVGHLCISWIASEYCIMWMGHVFDIHMSVHHKYISKLQPTRCNVSWFIHFYRRSACFRRFLRPSSGAHNCTYSFRYCQPVLLIVASVDEMELHGVPSQINKSRNVASYWL